VSKYGFPLHLVDGSPEDSGQAAWTLLEGLCAAKNLVNRLLSERERWFVHYQSGILAFPPIAKPRLREVLLPNLFFQMALTEWGGTRTFSQQVKVDRYELMTSGRLELLGSAIGDFARARHGRTASIRTGQGELVRATAAEILIELWNRMLVAFGELGVCRAYFLTLSVPAASIWPDPNRFQDTPTVAFPVNDPTHFAYLVGLSLKAPSEVDGGDANLSPIELAFVDQLRSSEGFRGALDRIPVGELAWRLQEILDFDRDSLEAELNIEIAGATAGQAEPAKTTAPADGRVVGASPSPEQASVALAPPGSERALTFVPGAITYRGHRESLSGKPRRVLQALAEAPGRTLTLSDLQADVWRESDSGQEAVRSAVSTARNAVRRVMRAAGVTGPDDPIPLVDRGTGSTAWRLLELP
jgi:hypothetical protein